MPILFVHGVNNRASDCDYFQECGLRKEMLDRLVVAPLRGRFPLFAQTEDAYWGDLGARFGWGLRSIPTTRVLESLGTLGPGQPTEDQPETNPDLLMLLAGLSPSPAERPPAGLERLGPGATPGPLAAAAREDPAATIRAIAAPERDWPTVAVPGGEPELKPDQQRACEEKGRERARVILAADDAAANEAVLRRVREAASDEAVLQVVEDEAKRHYDRLIGGDTGTSLKPAAGDLEVLGVREVVTAGGERVTAAIAAGRERIARLINGARALAERVRGGTARGASLAVLQARREQITQQGAIFFGDVFEYFRRGQVAGDRLGTIAQRVADHLLAAAKVGRERKEPLVLITHSFGSAITYDLLTSPVSAVSCAFQDLSIDRWIMAGSQAAIFAEMRAYLSSPIDIPSKARPILGKPKRVGLWLNFYDAADVFSYLAEPVFGKGAVIDIEVREGANLMNAHSNYFATPSFYQRIAAELLTM